MISFENLNKSFSGNTLFEDLSFKLNPREKLGLVGRNGYGKTTLFKLITGEEQPDSGIITVPKYYRIGQVKQQLDFSQKTICEEGMTGLPENEKDHFWKVEKILEGLGFTKDDMNRHPEEFSGGFQVRLNLAKVLVSEPDLLLLDEPTNYLDITSIRWFERFLNSWPHELMLITHDRSVMDSIVTHTMGINRKKLRKIEGNTQKYYTRIAQDEEIFEKTRINDEKKRKEVEQFITRFRAKARLANLVQSRIKTLSKMEKMNKLEKIKTLDFSFRSQPFPGKNVLNVENLSFYYQKNTPVIKNLTFLMSAHDRICVIGQNGKGKTTLLKLLGGTLTPREGTISYNPNTARGFFEQTNISSLVDTRTVEEEILYSDPTVDNQTARNICGAMMFRGDNALKKISVLSGGEKSRVMLGKILVTPVNLLLLDEPTNHLDMESCDALLAAIDHFDGAVIMVTHNEMFLNALSKRLIIFQENNIEIFEGGYPLFLEQGGWGDENVLSRTAIENHNAQKPRTKQNRKELKRRRSEIIAERGQVLSPVKKKIISIEDEIDILEKKLDTLNEKILKASQAQDGSTIAALSQDIHSCQSRIENLFEALEIKTAEHDEKKAGFEKLIEKLEE